VRSLFRPMAVLAMTGGMVLASRCRPGRTTRGVGHLDVLIGQYVINWTVKNQRAPRT